MRGSVLILLTLSACATGPERTSPEWIDEDSRRVIGGDIIHTGYAKEVHPELATSQARHAAVFAIVQECGAPHKNIKPLRSYAETQRGVRHAWAQMSIDFESCEEAKRGLGRDPMMERTLKNFLIRVGIDWDHPEVTEQQFKLDELHEEVKARWRADYQGIIRAIDAYEKKYGMKADEILQMIDAFERRQCPAHPHRRPAGGAK